MPECLYKSQLNSPSSFSVVEEIAQGEDLDLIQLAILAANNLMPCWYYDKQQLRETPSILDGLSFETERRYRKEGARFIMTCGTQMGLGHNTMATGVVYYHRFYMFHSFKSFPRFVTASCCLFLAGKVEETPKKCKDVIKAARSLLNDNQLYSFGEDPKEEVMTLERILLQTIKFDLQVEHPYTFLLKYAKCLKGDQQKLQKMVQMAWNFVNDSLSTTVCLQWEPEIIAVALIHLASKLSKFSVIDWTGRQPHHLRWWDMFVGDVTMEILEDICHQVLDLYQTSTKEPAESNSPPQKPPSRADSPPRENRVINSSYMTGKIAKLSAAQGNHGNHSSVNSIYVQCGSSGGSGVEMNNIQTIKSLANVGTIATQQQLHPMSSNSVNSGNYHNSGNQHHLQHQQQMSLAPGYHQTLHPHAHPSHHMYAPPPPPPGPPTGYAASSINSSMHSMYMATSAPPPPPPPSTGSYVGNSGLLQPPLPPVPSNYGPQHYGQLPPPPPLPSGSGPSTSSAAAAYYHQHPHHPHPQQHHHSIHSSAPSHHTLPPPPPPHTSSTYGRHRY